MVISMDFFKDSHPEWHEFSEEFHDHCILGIKIGTTGAQHGMTSGRSGTATRLVLTDHGSSCLAGTMTRSPWGKIDSIAIALHGEAELITFAQSLRFAADRLSSFITQNQI